MRITREVLEDFAAENVKYLELRTTPRKLADCDAEGYVRAVLAAFNAFERSTRDTTWPLVPRLLLSVDRSGSIEDGRATVELAARLASERGHRCQYVVGVDFSGNPTRGSFGAFEEVFAAARRAGLRCAAHVAEVDRPEDTDELLAFMPERLGHALTLNPQQLAAVEAARVPVEICPTSNMKTLQLARLGDHPTLAHLLGVGHPVSINTDDSGVFGTTATAELAAVANECSLTCEQVAALSMAPLQHSFVDEATRLSLLALFAEASARAVATYERERRWRRWLLI